MTAKYMARDSLRFVPAKARAAPQFELSIKLSSSRFSSLVDLSP